MHSLKTHILIFTVIASLFLTTRCGNKKYYSQRLKRNPSLALIYVPGDVIIQSGRKNYGRHDTTVALNRKFPNKIPETFRLEFQEIVAEGFRRTFPGASIKVMDAIPTREVRTIHGKISKPDYSRLQDDIVIEWKFDIYYKCRQSYYMDRCKGEIVSSIGFIDSEEKKFAKDILVIQKPLNYINPETEQIEEIDEIKEILKSKLPDALASFLGELGR